MTSVEGDTFSGSVKVKLGPIALVYNGSGTFVEKDEAAHRFVVDAKGKDKRGNGTAGAKVTLTMTDGRRRPPTSRCVTDLAITGKPAQFGRGVMQDVSDKLLGQFVACLEQRLRGPDGAVRRAGAGDGRRRRRRGRRRSHRGRACRRRPPAAADVPGRAAPARRRRRRRRRAAAPRARERRRRCARSPTRRGTPPRTTR